MILDWILFLAYSIYLRLKTLLLLLSVVDYSKVFEKMSFERPMKKANISTSLADCISSLPDDILAHILSFLSTKETVRTLILSKRWRKAWAHMSVFNLDIKEFMPNGHALKQEEMKTREANFSKFVRGVLQNREKLQLDTFRLDWSTKWSSEHCTASLVEEFVSHAIQFNPRVLSIKVHVFDCENLNLNHNKIFTCASLEEISLVIINEGEFGIYKAIIPRITWLPKLKRLELAYILIHDYCLTKLFRGCPALEELDLCECGLLTSEICSTVLKRLVLRGCCTEENLQLSLPRLMHLSIVESDYMMGNFCGNFASLVDASICFPSAYDDVGLAKVLNSLSNATSLDLTFEHLRKTTTSLYIKKVYSNLIYF
jgi:F-box domain